ncbi:MAG: hypothetical protein JW388_0991 [Nitrospira sp.]|nr:hypothetical protein [Nitrospira sp.]
MHAVLFEDLNRRSPNIGRLIVDQAAPEERDLSRCRSRNLRAPSPLPPLGKGLTGKGQDLPLPMDPDPGLHQPPQGPKAQQPIGHRCQQTSKAADQIRLDQEPIAPAHPARGRQVLFPGDHQPGKVQTILMRRRIGAMVVAELTVVTFVDDLLMVGRRQLRDIALILVDAIQQRVE